MRAIVFDLDDTLYPEHEFVLSGFRSISITGFYDIAARKFAEGVRKNVFDETLKELNIDHDEEFVKRLVNDYRNHTPDIHLFDDAKWALSQFSDRKVGIITDGYAQTQRNKVRALQLKCNEVIYTDDYGRENWKPSELPYRNMAKKLQVDPQHSMYIGDNPTKDFITAKKLGWTTVQIIRDQGIYSEVQVEKEYQAHYTIRSLWELENVLESRHGKESL